MCQTHDNPICKNGGQCIPNNDYIVSKPKFICICPKGFTGDRCELADNKLILSFSEDIVLSQSIFIHFIEIIDMHNAPVRATTFKTLPVRQESVIIHWSRPFHLVFIELFNRTYYIAVVQKIYYLSMPIVKMINPSDRCPHISEVLNKTMAQWHILRRIKYYHLPCQTHSSNLSCFYDDIHFCLCYDFGQQRLANCFNFDHNMTFNCLGQSECENDAQCLQDHPECPTRSVCICPPCHYGRRCQFSTNGFGLSLDAILGYHILPNLSLADQPFIIKISLALTIIFMVTGLINGILSLITFKNRIVCGVGCGLYLLGSSITTLLTMIMFGLKFFILLHAQMVIISNRSFLSFQCHSIDFFLRICLNMDQWLNACVAIERAYITMKGARFDKKKSKRTAKFIIIILFITNVLTCIHDPIYRHLIDEENDDDNLRRIWCIVKYERSLEIYNSAMHILHFLGPFMINLISTIILIKKKSHQQSMIYPEQTYREHLHEQYRQHKHLLTAPILLIILALPRLIITFISKCMQSANDSWLFLVGYFISFIPPMLTFVVFILPSKFYRKEFHKAIHQFRRTLQRRLHRL
jgi:hypothetical protein